MNQPIKPSSVDTAAAQRLIIALDVESREHALGLVSELQGHVGGFKVGLQLFTAAGPAFVRELCEAGHRIFLDLKFHDIPNTAARAAVEAARLGVWMFNVHALGGREMLTAVSSETADVCEKEGMRRPHIIAVTILTSASDRTMAETGIALPVDEQVARLSKLTADCGLDGVVASAAEAPLIRSTVADRDFLVVTPGIRPAFATNDDQNRVMTPAAAVAAGSSYLVVGRPVTAADDRSLSVRRIVDEIENATLAAKG